MPNPRRYSVYVIRLKAEVLTVGRVAAANSKRVPHKPCVYVGSTALTPAERYIKHLTAKSGSGIVKKFHIALHHRLTDKQPTFPTRNQAEAHEAVLADRLRRKGYAVWSR